MQSRKFNFVIFEMPEDEIYLATMDPEGNFLVSWEESATEAGGVIDYTGDEVEEFLDDGLWIICDE